MLGWIGRWAQSKGMKLLPSWLGVDKTTAQSQIVTEGFTVGTITESPSDVAAELANHNKVISQTPTSATAQDYETPVNITWRNFAFTPFSVFGFSPTPPFAVKSIEPSCPPKHEMATPESLIGEDIVETTNGGEVVNRILSLKTQPLLSFTIT